MFGFLRHGFYYRLNNHVVKDDTVNTITKSRGNANLDAAVLNTGVHGEQHLRQFVVTSGAGEGQQRLALLRGLVHRAAFREQLAHRADIAVRACLGERWRAIRAASASATTGTTPCCRGTTAPTPAAARARRCRPALCPDTKRRHSVGIAKKV